MNDMIDTSSDLRDLISVDFQELYVPYEQLDTETREQMDAEADERSDYYNNLTMSDILEG
jgi:hypothetical protein